jgi:hypothetical protein
VDWATELAACYSHAERMLGTTTAPRLSDGDHALWRTADTLVVGATFHPVRLGIHFGLPVPRTSGRSYPVAPQQSPIVAIIAGGVSPRVDRGKPCSGNNRLDHTVATPEGSRWDSRWHHRSRQSRRHG